MPLHEESKNADTMSMLARILSRLAGYCALLGGGALFAIVVMTAVHVAMVIIDKLFLPLQGIAGIEEMVAMLSGVAFFMVLPFAQNESVHVKADFIAWHRRIIACSSDFSLISFAVLYFSLAFALVFGLMEAKSDGVVTSVLSIPHWPFYIPASLSCFLSGVISLFQLLRQ